jgi:arylformamidase
VIVRRCFDISVPVSPRTTVYPGDPAPQVSWPLWSHVRMDPANVGFFAGGLHHGTHVDAPWHFIAGAKRLGDVSLDRWIGPCWVADLTDENTRVDATALDRERIPAGTRRLLLKTKNGQRDYWHEPWNPDFVYVHRTAAEWCVAREIWTLGLDYLTIDPPSEPGFPAHRTLLGNDVVIIENINLRDVGVGEYELVAAPINLPDADRAWCRALLFAES